MHWPPFLLDLKELYDSGTLAQQLSSLDAALSAAEQKLKWERSNEGLEIELGVGTDGEIEIHYI